MSDLRQDLVSGDWVVVAPERMRRPHDFLQKKPKRRPSPVSQCPFEDLQKSGNWPPIAIYKGARRTRFSADHAPKDWDSVVIPNKYPALKHATGCAMFLKSGPYRVSTGVGHHDLVITRDHNRNIAHAPLEDGVRALRVIQERYQTLKSDSCLNYIATFFNWGVSAGASLYHPHYQMLSLPIIPPDVEHSLEGSRRYYAKHRRCVHCEMLGYEEKEKKRIVEKNARAIAIAPFVSRQPFEVRVFPRKHEPAFEKASPGDIAAAVAVLRLALRRIERYLRDPDFNFFIHTAPLKNQNRSKHYHWHIEILPKITIAAGFELSTGVDIDVVDPDRAAEILRGRKI